MAFTREEKLWTMRMVDLEVLAAKLGIKINKKQSKEKAIEKILEAEKIINETDQIEEEAAKVESEVKATETETKKQTEKTEKTNVEETKKTEEKPKPKRGQLIEYNGKSQNICAWAKELGKNPNTLYGRIYNLGWTVEKAFTK